MQDMDIDKTCLNEEAMIEDDAPKDQQFQSLLQQLDDSYEQVVNLQRRINENYDCQVDVVETKVRSIVHEGDQKLSIAVDYLEEGLVIVNVNGQVERSNPSSRKLLGLEEQANNFDVKNELNLLGFLELLQSDSDDSQEQWGEYRVKNRSDRVIQLRWSDVKNDSDKYLGKVVTLRDVTDDQADEKAKTEFIAAITHELRTPLTIIQNSVSNILAGVTGRVGKKTRAYLDTILADCHRFGGLISDLLDMSKIETGKMSISRSAVRVSELVEDVINAFSDQAMNRRVKVIRRIDKCTPVLFIDRERIYQVLGNLLSNAIKFTNEDGIVVIHVIERKEDVVISVEDSGVGILPSLQKQVFNKFHQIGREAGAGYKGAGLGLAICNGIITMHGGKIWVESEPGLGSKFYFSVPKMNPSLILNKYMGVLSEKIEKKGGDFVLASVEFKPLAGEEDAAKMLAGDLSKALISESEDFLKTRGDMVLRFSDSELFFVVTDSKRFSAVKKKIVKVLSENAYCSMNHTLECILGKAIYPGDTREVIEIENISRLNAERII